MAAFSSSRYLLAFFIVNLYLNIINADTNLTFSYKNFGKDSSFESQLALFGDAKVARDNGSVQISGSGVSTTGRFFCKNPFNLVSEKLRKNVSFSNYFAFSISHENGSGIAFVMLPFRFPLNVSDGGEMGLLGERKTKFLAVQFDTFKNGDGDIHVSVKAGNLSSINVVLNGGEKLQSWINYEASGKRLEIRLSKFSERKPLDPLLTHPIDLSRMWGDDDVIVGFTSSSQNCNIYSWSFESRTMPHWMHSEPLDPLHFMGKGEGMKVNKRNKCTLRIVSALVFGIGFGALLAFFMLFMLSLLGDRRWPVAPEDVTEEFECKKIDIGGDETIEDGKVLGS